MGHGYKLRQSHQPSDTSIVEKIGHTKFIRHTWGCLSPDCQSHLTGLHCLHGNKQKIGGANKL